jgi:hypothetical protein
LEVPLLQHCMRPRVVQKGVTDARKELFCIEEGVE